MSKLGPENEIVFSGAPLPPSSNNQYMILRIRGSIRHVPSPELTKYKKAMDQYWLTQMDTVKFAREAFSGHVLSVHVEFGVHKSRLLTKKGALKKWDCSNRLKALHDALSRILLIDDTMFTAISARKYAVGETARESATIRVSITEFIEIEEPKEH